MKKLKWIPVVAMAAVLVGCGGEPGHHGTPSDPNEQQGNPDAHPEDSINAKPGKQQDADKAGKDPHTLTQTPDTRAEGQKKPK